MSLGQIIAEATMIARLIAASPDTTTVEQKYVGLVDSTKTEIVAVQKVQDSCKTLNPININLETGLLNPDNHLVNFQRVEIGNKDVSIKYDFNGKKSDVGKINIALPKDAGLALYKIGDWDGKDIFYWEAFKTIKVGDKSTMLFDIGTGAGKGREPEYFAIVNVKNNKLFVEGAIYAPASGLGDLDKSIYGLVAYDFGHAYLGLGKNTNTLVGVTGVKGFKDVGMLTLMLYDKETKGWSFISQTAAGNVNQGFFSKDNFDFVTELFAIPAFFPVHFSPQVTKGTYSIKINGAGNIDKAELEGKIGAYIKALGGGVSAGVNTLNKHGKTEVGGVVEVYKPFKLKNGISGSVEAKYNTRSKAASAYLTLRYNQR
ncbi:MAG: hypothetical protein ACP5N2_00900 [Candidatus Nanoarchaeia archaeon]